MGALVSDPDIDFSQEDANQFDPNALAGGLDDYACYAVCAVKLAICKVKGGEDCWAEAALCTATCAGQ